MITYDIVSNPSHTRARVLEFLPESYTPGSDDDSQMTLVCESSDEDIWFLEQDGINIYRDESAEKSFIRSILQNDFDKALKDLKFKF